jgi:hypothetical protein
MKVGTLKKKSQELGKNYLVVFFIRVRKIFSAVILRRVDYGIFNNWTDQGYDFEEKVS